MSNKYIFIHVPKTAGSMFRHIVSQNFGTLAREDKTLFSEMKYSVEQIDRLFYLYPFSFFSGHTFCLKSALLAQNGQLKLITFVRDPIEKALSAYFYLRNRQETNPQHPVKKKSFVDMVEHVSSLKHFDSFDLDSSQMDWLVGSKNADILEVEEAVSNGRLLLFPTEKFDVACLLLESLFPNDFKDCSYHSRINSSSKDLEINEKDLKAAKSLPWIERDLKLHALAQKNIDALCSEYFLSSDQLNVEIKKFHERCENKKVRKSLKSTQSTFFGKLKKMVNS